MAAVGRQEDCMRVFTMSCRAGLLALGMVPIWAVTVAAAQSASSPVSIAPGSLARAGAVDERFQSYNIEMVEVTGGRFWAPFPKPGAAAAAPPDAQTSAVPVGLSPAAFRYRKPIDLSNPRLRKLAAALSPAYVRVSGTWANSTYFQDSDAPAAATAPDGFGGVLTRAEWKGVIDFSKAVDTGIVTSFAISAGVRNAEGLWTPVEAEKILDFTRRSGGSLAAVEMFNEPTIASMGGAPKGYDAAAYGRDFRAFHAFMQKAAPEVKLLGPDGVGEGTTLVSNSGSREAISTADLLADEGPGLDLFAYHFYGAVSRRCAAMGQAMQTTPEDALSADWLRSTDRAEEFYAALRDKYEPGMPIWLTETAEAACGGNPWAASFIDSFRYLHQLGALAKRHVQVVMHNTLAASDYGLIDQDTLTPRPNYWSAVLWRRLMGTTVLDAPTASESNLYLYAHCLRGHKGGVAVLALNADRNASQEIQLAAASTRYSLTADDLMASQVKLNGKALELSAGGDLPAMEGAPALKGMTELPAASITFFAIPGANNRSCH